MTSLSKLAATARTGAPSLLSFRSIALAAIFLLPLLLAMPFVEEPFEKDEGTYATVAQGILDGRLPYRDLFDHKPPLVYFWYAVSFLAFGENVIAPRIFAALAWSATAAVTYLFTARTKGMAAGLAAAGLLAAFSGIVKLQASANTEVFMILPLVASLYAYTRGCENNRLRWFLVAGALGGIAALTKQVAVFNLFALATLLLVSYRSDLRLAVHAVASMAAGAFAVLAITLVPFVVTGSVDDFLYANVEYNQMYSGSLTLDDRWTFATRNVPRSAAAALLPIVLTAFALIAMRRGANDRFDAITAASLAAACLGTALSGFFFPHYFVVLLPFAAILGGTYLARHAATLLRHPVLTAVLILATVITMANNGAAFTATSPEARHAVKFPVIGQAEREASARDVAAVIRTLSTPEDAIYNYGRETEIYFYAGRRPAIPHLYDRIFILDPSTLPEAMALLHADPPRIIVDTANHAVSGLETPVFPEGLGALLDAQYELVRQMPYADIYRLR